MSQCNTIVADISKIPFIDSSDTNPSEKPANSEDFNGHSSLHGRTTNHNYVEAMEEGTSATNNRNSVVPDNKVSTNFQHKSGYKTSAVDGSTVQNTENVSKRRDVMGESNVTPCDDFDHSSIDQRTHAEFYTDAADFKKKLSFEQVRTQSGSLKMLRTNRLSDEDHNCTEDDPSLSISYTRQISEHRNEGPVVSQTNTIAKNVSIPTVISPDGAVTITNNISRDFFFKNPEQAMDNQRVRTISVKLISTTEKASVREPLNSQKTMDDNIVTSGLLAPPPKPPIRHLADDVPMDSVTFRAGMTAPTPPPRRNSVMHNTSPSTPSLSIRPNYRRASVTSSRTNTMKYNISRGMLTFPTLPRNARPPTRGIH
ncbi:unnamed protein product [Angiostrongylus costaricensis]|uniref:Flocculation protein FLO11-like n=1 Tax=Angiostrongylus costaricensis TaxID=334426 RepID=A0A0R3PYT6_ANGCS|nr:unnamed protein product [Angiostrongylus costaricensis]